MINKVDLLIMMALIALCALLAGVLAGATDPDLSRPCPTPTTITREEHPR